GGGTTWHFLNMFNTAVTSVSVGSWSVMSVPETGSPELVGATATTFWKCHVVPPPGATSSTRANRLASTSVSSCIAARVATSWASETPDVDDITSLTVSLL